MEMTGKLTRNAAVKEVKGGKKVTEFSMVLTDSYKPKEGDRVYISTFVECSYWMNPGLAEYLTKGKIVTVTGRLGAQAWLNKDNEPKATITCNVSNVKLLGSAAGTERADTEAVVKVTATGGDADDLPF
jgi:single-strand DNA-binding protein